VSYAAIAWLDIGVAALVAVAGLVQLATDKRTSARAADAGRGWGRTLGTCLVFLFAGVFFFGLDARNEAVQWVALVVVCLLVVVPAAVWLRAHHRARWRSC
jgi:Na+/melibiose symporter-like transporter